MNLIAKRVSRNRPTKKVRRYIWGGVGTAKRREHRVCLDFLVLLHQGKRTIYKPLDDCRQGKVNNKTVNGNHVLGAPQILSVKISIFHKFYTTFAATIKVMTILDAF